VIYKLHARNLTVSKSKDNPEQKLDGHHSVFPCALTHPREHCFPGVAQAIDAERPIVEVLRPLHMKRATPLGSDEARFACHLECWSQFDIVGPHQTFVGRVWSAAHAKSRASSPRSPRSPATSPTPVPRRGVRRLRGPRQCCR